MLGTKRSVYMREYMREYMRQRRGSSAKRARTDPEIGPPCPAKLPAGDVSTERLTTQSRLFKAHLAFALSQQTKIYEEMNLKAETFYTESLEYQVQLTELEVKASELEARVKELEAKLAQSQSGIPLPSTNLPASTPEESQQAHEQYLADKAAGLVDPDRRPKGAYDEILL